MNFFFPYPYKIWAAELEFVIEISINRLLIELSIYRYAKLRKSDQPLMKCSRLKFLDLDLLLKFQ